MEGLTTLAFQFSCSRHSIRRLRMFIYGLLGPARVTRTWSFTDSNCCQAEGRPSFSQLACQEWQPAQTPHAGDTVSRLDLQLRSYAMLTAMQGLHPQERTVQREQTVSLLVCQLCRSGAKQVLSLLGQRWNGGSHADVGVVSVPPAAPDA